MTKSDIIKDLHALQLWRRTNWKRQPGKVDLFMEFPEQSAYNRTEQLIRLFSVMTQAEYLAILDRSENANAANNATQQSLF